MGRTVTTGIYKYPVEGKHKVEGVNIEGDDQADRSVHGGVYKAIYGYPIEHYSYWKRLFPKLDFHHGMFGENLTTQGILEEDLYIGDKLLLGSVELMVVQPRLPCYKLGIKFGTHSVIKLFADGYKPGFYCKIEREGELEAGNSIGIIRNPNPVVTIVDIAKLIRNEASDTIINNAIKEKNLPPHLINHAKLLSKRS